MSRLNGLLALLVLCLAGAGFARAADEPPHVVIRACEACHGEGGNSHFRPVPRINGQRPHYILRRLAQLAESGPADLRGPHARVPTESASEIAQYFADAPATSPNKFGETSLGEAIYRRGIPSKGVAPCSACHGAQGEGEGPIPRLAGQHKAYLQTRLDMLSDFALPGSGVMHLGVGSVTPDDIDAVTSYLAAQ